MLTTGLLRVELAPEEYQLYSEGCGWEEEGRTGKGINMRTDVGPQAQQHVAVVVTLLKHCLKNIQKTYSS